MNRFDFRVVHDDVGEYLNKLEELANDNSNKENFLRDASFELHDRYIRPLMPDWNPNLIYSPLEAEHQSFEGGKGLSTFEILYTGKTRWEKRGLDKIFWEFAVNFDKFADVKRLARDYAFFQETGIDSVVNPKDYKPTHLHFVKRGTAEYETEFHYKTMAYLDRLMHLEKWERISPKINLYDYE